MNNPTTLSEMTPETFNFDAFLAITCPKEKLSWVGMVHNDKGGIDVYCRIQGGREVRWLVGQTPECAVRAKNYAKDKNGLH